MEEQAGVDKHEGGQRTLKKHPYHKNARVQETDERSRVFPDIHVENGSLQSAWASMNMSLDHCRTVSKNVGCQ